MAWRRWCRLCWARIRSAGTCSCQPPLRQRDRRGRCWAHVRRKFHDEYVDKGSELARQALGRIGLLYDIETTIRGRQPAERQAVRQARAGPVLEELQQWLDTTLRRVPGRSDLAAAICYARSRWCRSGKREVGYRIVALPKLSVAAPLWAYIRRG